MVTETELLVLKSVRYSDSNSIVHTYSKEYGAVAFKVPHTVRRKRDGMRGFLLPLALLSVTFNHFPKRDVQQPQEALLLHAPIRPSCDPRANALALFTTELLSHVLQAEQKDPHLYHYVTEQVRWLEKIPAEGLPSYHLSLLVGICHHLGILPTTAEYKPGYVLRLEEGCFAPPFFSNDYPLVAPSALLYQFITEPQPELLPLHHQQRNQLLQLLLAFLSHHYPNVARLQSPTILRTLFH